MSSVIVEQLTRGAERVPVAPPFPAVLSDYKAHVVEISLIGCRVEHDGRIPIGTSTSLNFIWQSQLVSLQAKVARSEFKSDNGRCMYSSGLQLCNSIFDAHPAVRSIIASLVSDVTSILPATAAPESVPFFSSDPDEPKKGTTFTECTFENGSWRTKKIWVPRQPREGITITTPASAAEVERLCREYELASPAMRTRLRAAAELAIARNRP